MTEVSIVIPARDAATTLGATLESVKSQTFADWEAIVIDDGSSDGTVDIALRHAHSDPRIHVHSIDGAGLATARNHGLARTRAPLVLFLDSDDEMFEDHLARLVDALRADPHAEASYCGYVRVTPSGQAFLPRFEGQIAIDPSQLFMRRNALAAHSILLTRERVEALQGFDARLRTCEDWDLWQRLAFAGVRFAPVHGLFARYNIRPGSMSANIGQLYADAVSIIESGFRSFDGPNATEQEAQSRAYFGLWCQAVALGRDQRLSPAIPALPPIDVPESDAKTNAMLILEALCTGACRSPAALAHDPGAMTDLVDRLFADRVSSDGRDSVRRAINRLLGIPADGPVRQVSVVIPAHKAETTIDETLHSVRAQSHSTLDIVVVDDGSPDATSAIVFAHAARDPRISLVRQSNAGVAAARNRGWKIAASDLVAFVDADDLWAPSKIGKQLDALAAQGNAAGLVYTWYANIDRDSRITSRHHRPDLRGDVLKDILRGNFVGNGSSVLISRPALEAAAGFDSTLQAHGAQGCEDYLIYCRIAEKFQFAVVPEALTGYRIHPENMSTDKRRMVRSFKLVSEEMISRHPEHRLDIEEGIANFLEWCILAAADRGEISVVLTLGSELLRKSPRHALAASARMPLIAARILRRRANRMLWRQGAATLPRFEIGIADGDNSRGASDG